MMRTYLERNDEKFAIQLGNFASKIDLYRADFGLTAAETSAILEDANFFQWCVNNLKKVDTYKRNWSSFKKILRKGEPNVTTNTFPDVPVLDAPPTAVAPGISFRFTTLVNRIKAHQNYTTAIGQNLGIEMSVVAKVDLDNAKPILKIASRGGKVEIDWKKLGFNGIIIEKDSGSGFQVLDKDFRPNFTDNSPLPAVGESAVWKYRAMYLYDDSQVGTWSDIVTISVAG
ncbi:MAG: hypothetical protein M0D53_15260 [Flavobacterium sp. JAD_PAG50586_2]|nr:MAG: hypothetical protein M0D53_15260 [Flavobacterium sp. JAD_PAG50586_2]